ncbi:MAG: hypothetical protein ACKO6N_20230, partial [Myxococcota bacterium]
LVQPPGQSCYVFVCGFRGELEPWQRLPGEAWLKAMECHTTEGQCFLLLLVENLGTTPRFAAVVEDPVGQVLAQQLPLVFDQLWLGLEAVLPQKSISATSQATSESAGATESGLASADAPGPARAHTGEVVTWHWSSRKGYTYARESWSCCGANGSILQCSRTPGRYHPGRPSGSGSRRSGGGGYGFWSCCWRALHEPGCKDEDALEVAFSE